MPDNALIVAGAGGGGKGGSGSGATSYAPSEVPDSLRSRAYVDVIYMLGEGPIQGLVAGPKSVFMNHVPLLNADGDPNFNGAEFWSVNGYQWQEPLPHESVSGDEQDINVEVRYAAPWTARITDTAADNVVLTIGFPQMAYQDPATGSVDGTRVSLQFFLQSDEAGYYAQAIGYGRIGGTRWSDQLIQSSSLAYDCSFTVRGGGASGEDDYVRYMQVRASVSADNLSWFVYGDIELLYEESSHSCVGTGLVSWTGGANFFVKIERISGDGEFRFDTFQFFGRSWVHEVEGKCMQRYQQQLRIPLTGNPPWDIRVVRLTPDNESTALANQTWVDSMRTETLLRLRYPNTALAAVRVPAESFSSLPVVKFHLRGLMMAIPANYDPHNGTYEGTWLGNWTWGYTANPVWCFVNLITHRRYGLGNFEIPYNQWELYAIAKYCDEKVADGEGGLMPRFRCDLSIDSYDEAYAWLKTMAAIFRGMVYQMNGALTAVADAPHDPEYLFTNANVAEGRFIYSGASSAARHTAVYVTWRDPDLLDDEAVEYVPDPQLIQRYGFNPTHLSALWCRNQRRARLIGQWLLAVERYGEVITFIPTTAEAACLYPGVIVAIADELRSGERIGGRITAATLQQITLDREVMLRAGVPTKLSLFGPDGAVVERGVANAAGYTAVIELSTPLDDIPPLHGVWLLTAVGVLQPQLARIVDIDEVGDGTSRITAVQHEPGLYNEIEYDLPIVKRPKSRLNPRAQAAPKAVTVAEQLYIAADNTVRNRVAVTWAPSPGALRYLLEWRRNSDNWRRDESVDTVFELDDARPGNYVFKVVAVSALGVKSPITRVTKAIKGKTAPPPKVPVFRIIAMRDGRRRATFRYRAGKAPLDLRGFKLRYGRGSWNSWSGMTDLHTGVLRTAPFDFTLYGAGLYTFAVKGVDTSGNLSQVATFRQATLPATAVDGVILASTSARELDWPGTVTVL